MAVQVLRLFAPVELDSSLTLIYTAPGGVVGQGRLRFTNTSGGSRTVTAYAVPNGGVPNSGNCFLSTEAVAASGHLDSDLPVLGPGDTLHALADATNSITLLVLDGVIFS